MTATLNLDTRQTFIDSLEDSITDMMAAHRRLSNVLLGQGFVVMSSHGQTMTYNVDAKGVVSNPHTAAPQNARRFALDDARTLAAATHDGTGQPFKAVHVLEALALTMAEEQSVVEMLRKGA
jgi:hypothetical protein